jgi:two-component system, NtrC family, nitrogen regulation sensor histidine kinase NtrY
VVSAGTNLSAYRASSPPARPHAGRLVGTVLVLLALATGGTSFTVLTGLTPVEPNEGVVSAAMAINTVLVVGLTALVGLEAAKLWVARRRGRAGARLHLRILACSR